MTVVKVIRLVGNSRQSWEEAASEALREAGRTIRDIQGIEATDFTATVQGGRIVEYRCTVNIAFKIEGTGGPDEMAGEGGRRAGGGREGGRGERQAGGGARGGGATGRGGEGGGGGGAARGGSAGGGRSGGRGR